MRTSVARAEERQWFTTLPPEEARVENNGLSPWEGCLPGFPVLATARGAEGWMHGAPGTARGDSAWGHRLLYREALSELRLRPPEPLSLLPFFPSSCPSRSSEDPAFSESKSFLQGHSPCNSSYMLLYIFNKLYSKAVTFRSSIFPSNWKIRLRFYYVKLIIPSE